MRHRWEWKTFGTLEEILRKQGVRDMYCVNCQIRFAGDYQAQCDKTPNPGCIECEEPAAFIRHTQFAGSHPFCDAHARAEDDFDPEDWEELPLPATLPVS